MRAREGNQEQGHRQLPVRVVSGHLGQGPEVLAVENPQGVGGVLGHSHTSQAWERP